MSSLASGHILRGAQWDYRILDAVKGDSTHASAVFKADVLPHENTTRPLPQWAIIKSASPDDAIAQENLDRECQTYRLPGVASVGCFRRFYDVIDKSTVALERLDTTLAQVKYKPDLDTYVLIREFLRAALAGCDVLHRQGYVNTDYKPANILIFGIKTGRVHAKVGDLGLVFPSGNRINAQPFAMRAPEVFLGQACTSPSSVWAIGAMTLCWIMPGILGARGSPSFLINDSWAMGKIKRLFPEWNIPTPDEVEDSSLKIAVKSAKDFVELVEDFQTILPFEKETQKVEMPQQLKDLLRLMLVTDAEKRPSASSVLESAEFSAFEDFVAGMLLDQAHSRLQPLPSTSWYTASR